MKFNKTISTLDLSNNYINEEGGEFLGTMLEHSVGLTNLNLDRNSLSDDGVEVPLRYCISPILTSQAVGTWLEAQLELEDFEPW